MAEGQDWAETTKIVLLPAGSRGDLQPFLALGVALKRAGYSVLVLTDTDSEPYVKEWGLDVVAVRYGWEEKMQTDLAIETMTKGTVVFDSTDTMDEETKKKEEEEFKRKSQEEFAALKCLLEQYRPMLMVGNTVSMVELRKLERQLRIPLVEVHLSPQHMPTEEFAPCHLYHAVPQLDPETPTGAIWVFAAENTARMVLGVEADLFAAGYNPDSVFWEMIFTGDLDTPEAICDWWFKGDEFPMPAVFAFSKHFWSAPAEWSPQGTKIVGNFKIGKEDQHNHALQDHGSFFGSAEELQQCVDFLAAGDPPVYVGWGSMIVRHPMTLSYLAVKALKLAGKRGILSRGWAKLSCESMGGADDVEEVRAYAKEHVLFLSFPPHEWLLPQCACAVHHGGCGTCHASLAAGVPSVVTPVVMDQPSNAARLESQRLGLACCHLVEVTPEVLAEKISTCCADEEMKANCLRTQELMTEENGTENMVNLLGTLVEEVKAGVWEAKFNARLESQEMRRRKRLGVPIDAVIAQMDRQAKQVLPEYKKYTERQGRLMMEFSELMKSESLFYVKASSGVVVREADSLKSAEVGRFAELAALKKLEQKGNRMKVKRLRGRGPEEGWISPTVAGRDVLAKVAGMAELAELQQASFTKQFGQCGYHP